MFFFFFLCSLWDVLRFGGVAAEKGKSEGFLTLECTLECLSDSPDDDGWSRPMEGHRVGLAWPW